MCREHNLRKNWFMPTSVDSVKIRTVATMITLAHICQVLFAMCTQIF